MIKRLKWWYRLSTRKVVELMQKQNWKCFYCYKKFDIDSKRLKPSIDHIHPRSKWGSESDEGNSCLACAFCNVKKWNISAEKFLDWYVCYSVWWREQGDENAVSYTIEKKVRNARKWYHRFIWYSL